MQERAPQTARRFAARFTSIFSRVARSDIEAAPLALSSPRGSESSPPVTPPGLRTGDLLHRTLRQHRSPGLSLLLVASLMLILLDDGGRGGEGLSSRWEWSLEHLAVPPMGTAVVLAEEGAEKGAAGEEALAKEV
jgi:hypothetical protein